MNRIERVGLFTSLKLHAENDDMKAIKEIVNVVLNEAQHVKPKPKNETSNNK